MQHVLCPDPVELALFGIFCSFFGCFFFWMTLLFSRALCDFALPRLRPPAHPPDDEPNLWSDSDPSLNGSHS